MLAEFDLSGRVILVTGAARGLGLFNQHRAPRSRRHSLRSRPPAHRPTIPRLERRRRTRQIRARHRTALPPDRRAGRPLLDETVEEIADKHGRMDGLVAAAGIQQETSALEYTPEDANRMFEINITGVFMTAQAVAKQMIKHRNGGSMAFIASMSATVANRGLICPAYNASKAGVVQLARNLASEWASIISG